MIQLFLGLAGFALWIVLNVIFWIFWKIDDACDSHRYHESELKRRANIYHDRLQPHMRNMYGGRIDTLDDLSFDDKYKVYKYANELYGDPIPQEMSSWIKRHNNLPVAVNICVSLTLVFAILLLIWIKYY